MEFRPLTAGMRDQAEAFVARIPDSDRNFIDPFLLHQVAVAGWTQATPGRRVVAVDIVDGADQVVGVVSVVPHSGWARHVGDFRLVVLPARRGQGVGRGLIERGIDLARKTKILKLTVEILATNEPTLAMFEALGWRREALLTRQVKDRDGTLQDLVLMAFDVDGG